MPISRSSSFDGSSSTTMAMLLIASRKRRGMDASASATRRSNVSRRTRLRIPGPLSPGLVRLPLSPGLVRSPRPPGRDDRRVVIALLSHDADVALRLWIADATAVENQRVRRPRPAFLGHRSAELVLDLHR